MPTLDMDLDYLELMENAAKKGDYKAAAEYEKLRNQKIDYLDETGTNKWGATKSNDYYGWIDGTNYAADILTLIEENADKGLVADKLSKRVEKSSNTIGMEGYAYDDIYDQAIQYLMKEPEKQNYGSFSYANAPSYTDKYSAQIDDLLNQILNREDFSYDVNTDPLYAQYARQYQQQGQRSMKDTLGQMAARTGGMASSYATGAAQQASDYYMGQLANKVPELYQLAYNMYLDDKASQVEDLGLLQDMSDTQYGRFRDTMSDWRNDRDFAYGVYRDDIADSRYESETAYEQAMNNAQILAGMGNFSGYAGLGLSPEEIAGLEQAYKDGQTNAEMGGGYVNTYQTWYDDGIRTEADAYDRALQSGMTHTEATQLSKNFADWAKSHNETYTSEYDTLLYTLQQAQGTISKDDAIKFLDDAFLSGRIDTDEEYARLRDYILGAKWLP